MHSMSIDEAAFHRALRRDNLVGLGAHIARNTGGQLGRELWLAAWMAAAERLFTVLEPHFASEWAGRLRGECEETWNTDDSPPFDGEVLPLTSSGS